jgi:hypothetical protein
MSALQWLPFIGRVVWLTREQGGRIGGPPTPSADHDYFSTAYVPPHGPDAIASFGVRPALLGAWRSDAEAGWLVVMNEGRQTVTKGSAIVITEGPRVVGYFHVYEILD